MSITASLVTKVRNTSGEEKTFGYLRNGMGKTLAAGEEYEEPGDLAQKILARGPRGEREIVAYNNDLEAGRLSLVSSPKDHFYDETADGTKVLKVDNDTVSAVNPSWGQYSSSIGG